MSDFHAIGGVSATLQTLLLDRMELPVLATTPTITIGPPAFTAKDTDPHPEDPRVNLFLYRVTENGFLQNQEIPGRGASAAYGHPPLSLNLHYLVTAYGNIQRQPPAGPPTFDETNAQFLLGSAMRVLHDVPIVTDTLTTVRVPSGQFILHQSLRGEYEHVKLALEPLSLEDVTKVWTALALRFRLSAAYVVTVVQIESQRPRRFPRPVGKPLSPVVPPLPSDPPSPGPMVYVLTIQSPTITDLKVRRAGEVTEQPFPYARIGDTLVLRGTSLSGPVTMVAFGDLMVPATIALGDRVEADVPDANIPGVGPIPPDQQLQPGVCTVQVVVRDPLTPQGVFTSNDAAYMLVPTVTPALLAYLPGPPRSLVIQGERLIGPTPGGETVIGRSSVPRSMYVNPTPTKIQVPIPDTLPARGVNALISGVLTDPVAIPANPQTLDVNIGGTVLSVTGQLPAAVPLASLPALLASLIHDAAAGDTRFLGARVDLWTTGPGQGQLVVVPGGLTDAIAITSTLPATIAGDLKLTVAQPPGATSALLSGVLGSPPPISSSVPRISIQIGAPPAFVIAVPKTTSLVALAASLEAAINAASGVPAYAAAKVRVSGSQLLVIPGAAQPVTFTAAPGDDTTVVELQLHAQFAVRVRVNGSESIDSLALVDLPR